MKNRFARNLVIKKFYDGYDKNYCDKIDIRLRK